MMWLHARTAAAALRPPPMPNGTVRKARVTVVESVGPPAIVTVHIENNPDWEVPGVPVSDHIDTPAVDDGVWVTNLGHGDRIVTARV